MNDARRYKSQIFKNNLFQVLMLVFVNIKNNFDKTIKLNDVFDVTLQTLDVTAQTFVVTTGKSQESDETF